VQQEREREREEREREREEREQARRERESERYSIYLLTTTTAQVLPPCLEQKYKY
jgi:hypothetical protein